MAIQFIPLVVAIMGGAATVGAGVVAYQKYNAPEVAVPQPPIALKQSEPAPIPKPEIKIVEEKPELPKFHLLRVEKDGSAVIAGSAPSKSSVEILLNETAIAKAKATSGGDFAIVLDNPLKPGNHELYIRATTTKGVVLISEEAGLIHVPEKDGELLAMVTKPGAASKLIQKPKPVAKVIPTPKPEVKKPVEVVVEKPAPIPAPAIEKKPVAKPVPKPVIVAKVEPKLVPKPTLKPIVPKILKPVLVEAVEVENDAIFIAGTGEPGHTVNLYLDSLFLGGAQVGKQGAYLLEVNHQLKFGMHKVRADMLAKKSTQVIARAQVPLLHEGPVEKPVVVAKAPEPKPVTQTRTLKPAPVLVEKAPAVIVKEPVVEVAKVEAPKVEVAKAEVPVRVIRTGSSVIIRRGDSLWRVSRRTLGQGFRYSTIYDANRTQIKNPHLIFPGQIFKIPKKHANSGGADNG